MTTPRPKRYPSIDQTGYVTLRHIAAATGMSERNARKFLWRHRDLLTKPIYGRLGQPKRWPATVVEEIRALTGRSHDDADPTSDWLARYTQEGPYGSHRSKPPGDGGEGRG